MSVKITCIEKDKGNHENPYVAISRMKWKVGSTNETGSSTREQVYDFVSRGGEVYVKDASGNKAKLEAKVSTKGTKYVKTVADDVKSDNLLKLPECK
jgi:hypothetical protein